MKNILKLFVTGFLFVFVFSLNGFSQTNYSCFITRVLPNPNPNTFLFDVWLRNTGTTSLKVAGFQAGIDFNYAALANGGTISAALVPGSVDAGLVNLGSPQIFVDPLSHQLRIVAKGFNQNQGNPISSTNPVRLGTFNMTNTTAFSAATPSFTWSFVNSTSSTTRTLLLCYVNGTNDDLPSNITNPSNHIITGNAVPTLSQWGLIIFSILLIITGSYFIRQHSSIS